ncbi:unnamed protein product [Amoebophrya sp. A120]|nr:unnamed protein product [Amoebophrya sp. A120]|eukprot:GSA120T00000834001.1
MEDPNRKNFLEKKIDNDLAPGGRSHGKTVTTRFPPEPNGYLHIGHAKSILLNFGLAKKYDGQCNMRFDDTNPVTEETEYVESILQDVEWVCEALELPWVKHGEKPWRDNLFYASDYFDLMFQYAKELIEVGKAYVDSQTPEEVKTSRENGTNSPFRERSVAENMKLFEEMQEGKHPEGTLLLRAKIDMQSPNFNLRDPPIYRIRFADHHRTGSKWKVYPIYDFAHGQEDAIEHITHSICTLEFENHNILYRWFIENIPSIPSRPEQTEFARLNLVGAVTSKRKLLRLVNEKRVMGWDDPRLMTICGLRRRGVRPQGIKRFCDTVGVTNTDSMQNMGLLEESIRLDLDPISSRRMVVLDPLEVEVKTYSTTETIPDCASHPSDKSFGARALSFSSKIFIDREDFQENAPADFYRFSKVGGEVKLRFSYVIKLEDIIRDPKTNKVTKLVCSHDPATRDSMPTDRKVKGIIHWVDGSTAVNCEVRLINQLFNEFPKEGDYDMMDFLNPESLQRFANAKAERALKDEVFEANKFSVKRYQFERKGFYCSDRDSSAEKLVFNRIVQLKESAVVKNMQDSNQGSRKEEQERQKAEKDRLRKIAPTELFKQGEHEGKYSKFDDKGLPTHDAEDAELTKSMRKKLQKEWEKQDKLHQAYLKEVAGA